MPDLDLIKQEKQVARDRRGRGADPHDRRAGVRRRAAAVTYRKRYSAASRAAAP